MSGKSILEQALLQVQTLEEAVKQNAKGILASTMKQELTDLLKESMDEEEDEVDEQLGPEDDENDVSDENTDSEVENNEFGSEEEDSEEDEFNTEDSEEDSEDDEFDSEDDEFDSEEDDDTMDMTGASDAEVLKVFKAMKPDDGIIVKKDGGTIQFSDGDADYIIKLDDEVETPSVTPSFPADDSINDEEMNEVESEEEEVIVPTPKEKEMKEASRTIGNGVRGPSQKTNYKAGRHEMNEEVAKLKKQNGEYKKALILFKDKLNEVAIFNASLAYTTRLFTEHTTTKQEKMEILKRFDSVSTMNESKNLFNTIKSELETKKPVTESVITKIKNTPTSSSKEMLAESKAYENPQFKRMKDLISKI